MNETTISKDNGVTMREQPSGELYRSRCVQRHVCCVGNGQLHQLYGGGSSYALNCMHDQQIVIYPGVGITSPQNGNNPQPGDPAPSLTNDSRNYTVYKEDNSRKYIIRRLTPLECNRLQGFPDNWGAVSDYVEISDEDIQFWEQVRKTEANIKGKDYKPKKSKKALVNWLNKLHNDSSEYRMWGNGIALPCAVDVLGRIESYVNNSDGGVAS